MLGNHCDYTSRVHLLKHMLFAIYVSTFLSVENIYYAVKNLNKIKYGLDCSAY